MHVKGRIFKRKNRIWGNRSATQSLPAVRGTLTTFKMHIGHISCNFGKTRGHIELLEMGEILHMGCCGRKFGPGLLSTARRTRQKEKRGAVARLSYSLSTIAHTSDCSYDSRSSLSMTFLTSSLLIQPISECNLFISFRSSWESIFILFFLTFCNFITAIFNIFVKFFFGVFIIPTKCGVGILFCIVG